MNNLGVEICPLEVLGCITCKMAIGSATALLEGEIGLIVDLNLILPSRRGIYALHVATNYMDYNTFELGLTSKPMVTILLRVVCLSLNIALENLRKNAFKKSFSCRFSGDLTK